jgi:hypothetical protein
MKAKMLIIAAGAATLLATPALAQETQAGDAAGGALTGGLTGAAIGGVVGGPMGAAIGGAVGVSAGAAGGAAAAPPPPYVVNYVAEQPVPSITLDREVAIGEPLPSDVQVYEVPRYREYGYTVINNEPVIVDRRVHRVVDIIHEGRAATPIAPPARVVMAPPPAPVREYVVEHEVPSVTIDREVEIGQPLPETVSLYRVPRYRYEYATVNGETTIVDPYTRQVVDVVR